MCRDQQPNQSRARRRLLLVSFLLMLIPLVGGTVRLILADHTAHGMLALLWGGVCGFLLCKLVFQPIDRSDPDPEGYARVSAPSKPWGLFVFFGSQYLIMCFGSLFAALDTPG